MTRRRFFRFNFDKRKKFVLSVLLLSSGLLISQFLRGGERVILGIFLSILAVVSLFLSIYEDIKGTFHYPIFILPFFYTLALSLFYFLLPERFLTRIAVTIFFAMTIYSLFLAHNIYAVSSIRTVQLLRAAHAVSFFLTIIAFFILVNMVFTLHLMPYVLFVLLFGASFILIIQILWSTLLEASFSPIVLFFSLGLSLILAEIGTMLSFWPVLPTVAALFLSGNFYTFVGLSQHWLEKRLFKGILWEYIWVVIIVFVVLIFTTTWG